MVRGTIRRILFSKVWRRRLRVKTQERYPNFQNTFINPEEVGDCFFEGFIGMMPSAEKYQHLTQNYIDFGALFPLKFWASRNRSLQLPKNAFGSFRSHFSNYFYHAHPDNNLFIIKSK